MKRSTVLFLLGLWAMGWLIGCSPLIVPTPLAPTPTSSRPTTFTSLPELQAAVSFSLLVPSPTVSPTLTFVGATLQTTEGREALDLTFTTASGDVTLQQVALPPGNTMDPPTDPYETMLMRGLSGYLITLPTAPELHSLIWAEQNRMIAISGPFPGDVLSQIGESLDEFADPFTGGIVPLATPDLAGLEQLPWSSFSPDGTWAVQGMDAIPTQSGEHYYTEMRVSQVAGDLTWTPIAGWQPFGLGYTTPRLVHWSTDGRYLYYTNAPHPDGCGLFVNASDLQRLDLTNGLVQEILPQSATWVLEAAPDGTVAYVDQTTLVFFDPVADARQDIILDFAQSDVQLGNLVWSPDSQQVAFTTAFAPCILPDWRHAIYVVDRQGKQSRMVVPPDERRFHSMAWLDAVRLLLIDFDNQQWELNVVSGQLRAQGEFVTKTIVEATTAAQRFLAQAGGDPTLPITFVSINTTPYQIGRVYMLASAQHTFEVNVTTGAVVQFGPSAGATLAEPTTAPPRKTVDQLGAQARALLAAQMPEVNLDQFTAHHGNKEEQVYFFRWEDTSRMIDGMPVFAQVGLSAGGEIVSYTNTFALVEP